MGSNRTFFFQKSDDARYMTESEGCQLLMEVFKTINQSIVNQSFRKTTIPKFNKDFETEFTEEQIQQMLDEEEAEKALAKMVSCFILLAAK